MPPRFLPAFSLSVDAVRVKCSPDDTVGDLKKLIAAQTGTDHTKIQLKKWCVSASTSRHSALTLSLLLLHASFFPLFTFRDLCAFPYRYTIYKDHITLADYEIHDGMSLEMY